MNKYRLSTLYFILLREGFYPLSSNNDFIGLCRKTASNNFVSFFSWHFFYCYQVKIYQNSLEKFKMHPKQELGSLT